MKDEHRTEIAKFAKTSLDSLVYFDQAKEPVSPSDQPHLLYVLYIMD